MKLLTVTILFFAMLFFQNCAEVQFADFVELASKSGTQHFQELIEDENIEDLRIIIYDSFERDNIFSSNSLGFAWREFVEDNGNSISEGFDTDRDVDAKIVHNSNFGPVADLERAVFFRGRKGGSFHKLHLMSKTIDLSNFEQVVIDFSFLSIDLEYAKRTIKEGLVVEVCVKTAEECGVNDDGYDKDLLANTGSWKKVYNSSEKHAETFNNGLRGKDHTQSQWVDDRVFIDLSDLKNKSQFIFRFSAYLDEGFYNDNTNSFKDSLEDGLALDKVVAMAFNPK